MPGLKERAKTLVELLDSAYYLYAQRPLHLDDKAASLLAETAARASPASMQKLDAVCRLVARERRGGGARAMPRRSGVKLGQVAQPLARRADRAGDLARVCSTSWRCSAGTKRCRA